jgi:hypothetical protein
MSASALAGTRLSTPITAGSSRRQVNASASSLPLRSLGLITLIGRDADDLDRRWRNLQAWAPRGALRDVRLRDWAMLRLVGDPAEILTQLRIWDQLGVEQVICGFGAPFGVFDDEQLELFAERILPHIAVLRETS